MKKGSLLLVILFSATLLWAGNKVPVFYGMTSDGGTQGGTIFRINADGTGWKIFSLTDSTGREAFGNLIAANGKLFGMTFMGGAYNHGTIFRFDTAAWNVDWVYTFDSFSSVSNTKNANGGNPDGSLFKASDGKLYGMTSTGGSAGYGVIFSLDISGSTPVYKKEMDFTMALGVNPVGNIIQGYDGNLYGLTIGGGSTDGSVDGVLFKANPTDISSSYSIFCGFDNTGGTKGHSPIGSVVEENGYFRGVTVLGGTNDEGTLFKVNATSGVYSNAYNFGDVANDGLYPYGSLLKMPDTTTGSVEFYGMLSGGGASFSSGVIFALTAGASELNYSIVANFCESGCRINSGTLPLGELILASDSNLYGMTYEGGGETGQKGTIFRYTQGDSVVQPIWYFMTGDTTNGAMPKGDLLQAGVTVTTGITEINNAPFLSIYPNPSTGMAMLVFNSDNEAKYLVSVRDITGKMVASNKVTVRPGENKIPVDIGLYSAGLYFVTLTDNNNLQYSVKLVKQ